MDYNSFLQGQPPQQQPELSTNSQHTMICSTCVTPISTDYILCSKCLKIFHLHCAKIVDAQNPFTCVNCSGVTHAPEPPQIFNSHPNNVFNSSRNAIVQNSNAPEPSQIVYSHRSNASNSSIDSIIRKRNLQLQRLEEERQLAIERDREFLNRKYKLLEQAEEEKDDSSTHSNLSVSEWLNSQPDPQINSVRIVPPNQQYLFETTYLDAPVPTDAQVQLTSANNNNPFITFSTNDNNNPSESVQNTVSIDSVPNAVSTNVSTGFVQNKTSYLPINSTFHNTTTTFIDRTSAAPTTTTKAPDTSFNTPLNDTSFPSFSCVPSSSMNSNLTYQQINARQTVPKDLPMFTGKPEEWPLFSSTYNWSTAVCGLTDAENLVRLQKALRGDALQAVQHILIHPSCVPTAISTLKLLYGQPEKILHSLKMKIRNLPTVNPNKLETITSFAVQVKGLQATIEACGLLEELNNSSLLQELISKLPSYFQINWGTYKMNLIKNNNKCNLSDFANWIFDIGLSASSVNIESNMSSATEYFSRDRQRNAFVHTHSQQSGRRCMVCKDFCSNISSCPKFITADRAERWNIVRECKLCRQCLRKHFGACNSSNICGIDGCQFKHHSLLHKRQTNDNINQREIVTTDESNKSTNQDNPIERCNTHSVRIHNNFFKIIPITIYGNQNKYLNTFAFIDEGSSTSLIDEKVINDLKLTGTAEPLCLKWTGNVERSEERSRRLCVNLSGANKKRFTADVHTVKHLSLPQQTIDMDELVKHFKYLKGLPIQSYVDAVPTMLIGLNNSRLFASKRIKEGKINEPIAVSTRLGWLIYGSVKRNSLMNEHHYHICECGGNYDNALSNLVKMFYSLETSGIKNASTIMSKDDEKAISILNKCTKQRSDGHYETSLLWRNNDVNLPDSYDMARKRLLSLEKRLKCDANLNIMFHKTISEYISKGYVTKIANFNSSCASTKSWYLPIFPVFNRNKPGKARIVWDAAAKSNGVSLNSMLMKGPDLLSSLPSILFRFRQKSIGVCGDIEQMFHQIFIRKEDRDVQRFLWRTEDNNKEPDTYIMNVMIFGATCAPCISQYVKNMNASKFEEQYPLAAAAIMQNHYVDDFLDSVDTAEEAINLTLGVKYIHSKAGFNIRNWLCNDKDVLKELNENEVDEPKSLQLGSELNADKVLGVFWIPTEDVICYKISSYILQSELFLLRTTPTKRKLLKILMSIYDPLGLIGHYLMYLKIVLQEVWRNGTAWDEEIGGHQLVKWTKWLSHMTEIQNLKIARCYLQTFQNYNNLDVQLHTFADASENGYAAVSYLRISDGNNVVVSLVGSKTRVAPLRIISIPRLELMAALIAARFAKSVAQSMTITISRKIFWSDSKTVICWLKSDHRRYQQFVAFRVSEIIDITDVEEWRWISGKLNVADEATKWCKNGPDLTNNSRWLNGPSFLMHPESKWPCEIDVEINTDCELRQQINLVEKVNQFVDIHRFSQWRRVLRAVANVIHFINKIKKATKVAAEERLEELKLAEILLIKQAQREVFSDEVFELENDGKVSKNSSIFKLSPYTDGYGVLRIDGRIDKACVPDELKHPAIMPKYSRITELLILHYHCQYHHGSHETAINEIRQKYHVPRLRTVFKMVTRKCQMCKVKKAVTIYPQMAKLPRARLSTFVAAFTFTGVDFFGPIFVTVNRHKEKRYGALFTCLTIRAVHVEIVHSLNTSSCILAIRNFIARRGTPREFFSDNGTNFVGAERELREAIKEVDCNEFVRNFTTATAKWNFNPPAAPHMGGAWERMVRSIKTVLYKIMPTRSPSDETLRGMMSEVENIINSRPLTYVPIDDENQEALTPKHLLLGCSNGMKPLAEYEDSGVVLRNSWLISQQYAEHFWKRWLTEYLPSLTCRSKWFEKSKPLSIGDLVVVVDPSNPRNVWPRGKVVETKIADDGQVRSAKVMTSCGVLERPVAKLAVLDVAQEKE